MSVHITILAATARFFDVKTVYGERYAASAVLQWEGPKALIVSAFTVNSGHHVTRTMLREFVAEIDKLGIERLRSTREQGRILPLGKLQSDGTFTHDVAELLEYCKQQERRRHPPAGPPAQQRRQGEKDWQSTVPGVMDGQPLEDHVRATDPPAEPVRRAPPAPAEDPPEGTPT